MATPALWGKAKSESKSCFQALPALVPRASPSVKMTMWNQPVRTDLCQKVKDSTIIMNIYMMADAVFMMINTFRAWRAWWKRRERPGWERWWTWWSRRRSLNLKKISNNLILVSQSKSVILFQLIEIIACSAQNLQEYWQSQREAKAKVGSGLLVHIESEFW